MKKLKKLAGAAVILLTAVSVIYIMANGLGLVDSLDFGAGAYYYADIPGFAKFVDTTHYQSPFPMWIYIVLFLAWGALMYKVWTWIDKKASEETIEK